MVGGGPLPRTDFIIDQKARTQGRHSNVKKACEAEEGEVRKEGKTRDWA